MKKILIFSLIIFYGCAYSAKEDDSLYNIGSCNEFISINTARISPYSECVKYYKGKDKEWLFYQMSLTNEIIIYSLPEGNIVKRLQFAKRGPQRIGTIHGFYVHNMDSIFLASKTFYSSFFLTDTLGVVKQQYNLNKMNEEDVLVHVRGFNTYPWEAVRYKNGILSFFTSFRNEGSNKDLCNEKLVINYNLKQNKIDDCVNYPVIELSDKYNLTHYSGAFTNQGEFCFAFEQGNCIYNYSNKKYKQIPNKSRFQTEELYKRNIKGLGSIEDCMRNYAEHSAYELFIYDSYRELYYRFFYPGVKLDENDDPHIYWETPKVFSIQALDKDFNVIAENMMAPNTYNYKMSFITDKGLYLALHPNHSKYNPNKLTFERFNLYEKKENM
jgi:hypothetical protein